MAIDPARISRRMVEAEESGRPALGVGEAGAALRALAVVAEEEPQGVPQRVSSGDVVALVQAS